MLKQVLKTSALTIVGACSLFLAIEGRAASVASLPNGTTSLHESYQAWGLTCETIKGANRCVVEQQVWNQNPRQRLLTMRLQPEGMQLRGSFILPFGIDLPRGVTILVDGTPVGEVLPFSTCLPIGCIVPLDLDRATLERMEKSQTLEVSVSVINGKEQKFTLSSQGLSNAMKRAVALVK